ncbi:hypothetical protein J2Z42_001486 [Clostridium algifaecis]|uniref:Uncharacterized protein n=1 Tax=Clostridium algifaecis TaxID=1472040 RepID=A0ABS4KS14_9CLOT|nr:hypothetical protein [Clostridium algifaecis]MBP2032812.1 hypothetical protein [Clostridium algifaecis]
MKVLKKITICIIISLIIQFGGLFYINNYFLASNTVVKSKKVVNSSNKASVFQVNVPNNAKSVNISYDANYIAYYLNNALYVVNTKTGKSNNVSFSNGVKLSFYKWLPDRNRMLIAEKENSNLLLSYYDVDKSQKNNITKFAMISSTAEVTDIEAAPLPNVIYIKVSNGAKEDVIYWVNIMKSKKKINTKTYNIGNMEVVPHEDKMVYEDLINNKVYATGINNAFSFIGSTKSCLLEIDNNDQVYIGDVDSSNNIGKIYFGTLKNNTSSWQTLQLNTPVSKANLFVTARGKVYINDTLKGTVEEFKTGKKTTYKCIFLQPYSDGITSINNGILVKTPFN